MKQIQATGVIVTDSADTIFFANRVIFDIMGIPQERLPGVDISSLQDKFPGMDVSAFSENYLEAKGLRKPLFYEHIQAVTPHGRNIYLSGWMIPKITEDKYNGMTCTLRDTTRSQELTMLLRITLDNNPHAIGISKNQDGPGRRGTTYYSNKKMRQLFGLQETDYKNISIRETLDRCEKRIRNKKEWREFLKQHTAEGTEGSLVIRHTNGKEYKWSSTNLQDNTGKPWGLMAVVKEVGLRRRKGDK